MNEIKEGEPHSPAAKPNSNTESNPLWASICALTAAIAVLLAMYLGIL